MAPRVGLLSGSGDKSVKEKISLAIREVEVQRKEVEQLRVRLNERRNSIFNAIVRAYEQQDEMRARVFSNEHVELQKVTRVVSASELALLHIVVRLETLRDVGDVMYALSSAFKEVKRIGKSIENLAPNLETAANEINDSFTNILAELGVLTPNVSIALSDTPQEIFAKAQALIKERTSELGELPRSMEQMENAKGTSLLEQTKKIALLASGEDTDADSEEEFKPTILVGEREPEEDPDHAVRGYIRERGTEKIDIIDCSAQLNLPVDLVEQAYIKLLSERRPNASSKLN
jgi:division protein CdvB (Snf7/Vps24/ESCRT-III family)